MQISGLSKGEARVLSGLAMLGDAVVARDVFSGWIGGHAEAISPLAESGWIRLETCGAGEMLSISEETRDMVRDTLKPGLGNCGWAAGLLGRIASGLAGQQETARLKTGAKSRIWYEPDELERAMCVMPARLALNILKNLDFTDIDSISISIDFLSRCIRNDVHCALYFALQYAAPVLERIVGSPCFNALTDRQKFDAYNMLGIAWAAALGDYFIKLPESLKHTLPEHRLLNAIFGKRGYKKHVENTETAEVKAAIKAFYKETGHITGRIAEHYTDTEQFVGTLPDEEKSLYLPLIYLPLMQYIISVCKNHGGRPIFYNSEKVFRYISNFESRNELSGEASKAFGAAYKSYRAELFPKSHIRDSSGASPAPDADGADAAPPEKEDAAEAISTKRRLEYFMKITECITLSGFDRIAKALVGDGKVLGKDKIHELQSMVKRLGFSPFKAYFQRSCERELRRLTENRIQKGKTDTKNLILYCSETRKQRRAEKILNQISMLRESAEMTLYGDCLHCAQLIMLAASKNDHDGIPGLVGKYFSLMLDAEVDDHEHIWRQLMPIALSADLSEKLYSKGSAAAAKMVAHEGLRLLELEAEKPGRAMDDNYYIYGLAARLAEGVEDLEKAAHYKRMRGWCLGLGYALDIYGAMGRDEY